MQILIDIQTLIAEVRAAKTFAEWLTAFGQLSKIIAEVVAAIPKASHAAVKALMAGKTAAAPTQADLCDQIDAECVACKASGSLSPALLALLLKLAPLLLALLGV